MATFYFDGAVDGDWTELGNWWNDAGHTEAAASLPTAADSAVASASITAPVDYESPPAIAMLTVNNASLEIPISVSGMATFIGSAVMDSIGQVNGNATFNDTAYSIGYVSGNATFNNNAENFYDSMNEAGGTVNGNATFNDSSINYSTVNGNATFNDNASNSFATVSGDATFNGSSLNNEGTVTGNATFNGSSYNDGFSSVGGNATFNNSTYNYGDIGGNATFNDDSYIGDSYGTVGGNATFNGNSYINQFAVVNVVSEGGTFVIGGTATFSGNARNNSGIGGNAVLAYSVEKGINGSSILGVV